MKSPILILIALFLMVDVFWSSRLDLALAIENKSRVISPYWQSDSGSYSFIAVSHSSLSSIATQVGMVINAIQSDLTAFGTAITFTISGGSTERILSEPAGLSEPKREINFILEWMTGMGFRAGT